MLSEIAESRLAVESEAHQVHCCRSYYEPVVICRQVPLDQTFRGLCVIKSRRSRDLQRVVNHWSWKLEFPALSARLSKVLALLESFLQLSSVSDEPAFGNSCGSGLNWNNCQVRRLGEEPCVEASLISCGSWSPLCRRDGFPSVHAKSADSMFRPVFRPM